jgi:DNA (cytosine-5)-methyltransferase 1
MSASLRVGGMFAGYGGLERALHDALGAEPAWFAEYEPPSKLGGKPPRQAAAMILAHHWPDVPNHGDVTAVDWSAVEPVDIIAGGSPCQDLSPAGKRAGMKPGTRSGLWASMLEAVRVLRPSLVCWENVRGALSAEATSELEPCAGCVGGDDDGPVLRALGRVLGDLAGVGYDAAWTGLRAADVGAPHGRFRVFVVAWPTADPGALSWPTADPGALLPTPAVNGMGAGKAVDDWDEWTARMQAKHGNGNGHGASLSIEALRLLPSPRTSDTNGAGEHGQGGLDLRTAVSLLPTPTTRDLKGRNQRDDDTCLTGALLPTPRATDGTKGGPNQRGSSGDLMLPSAVMLMPTPTAMDSRESGGAVGSSNVTLTDATERGASRGIDFGIYASAITRWEALTRPAPSPTEPTGKGGAHRLSARFEEWMMGLPDGWVTEPSIWSGMKPAAARNAQIKALGNGVVPQQGAEGVRRCLAMARSSAVAL